MTTSTGEPFPASPSSLTVGMRLDALIAQVDRLSSTQLYGIIVLATVGICVVLLGTGSSTLDLHQQQQKQQQQQSNSDDGLKKPPIADGIRQPRWHIFRWVNYLAVVAFLWSVCTFCLNASQYLHHESQGVLVQFLVGWSVFLLYFFGFFGVSLIHQDIPQEQPQQQPQQQRQQTVADPNVATRFVLCNR
jgi:hypothetical protein